MMRSVIIKKQNCILFVLGVAGIILLFLGWRGNLLSLEKPVEKGLQVTSAGGGAVVENSDVHGPISNRAADSAVAAQAKGGSDFYVEYRLERERTRGQQVEWLREVINNTNTSDESRQKAQEHLMSISRNMEKEVELENLIRAKGFKDAVVFVDSSAVNVVVSVENLSPEESSKILDLVSKRTGIEVKNITVLPKA